MPAMMENALNFLLIATEAAQALGSYSKLEPAHDGAIVSVVFAASALEAFINERTEWAVQLCDTSSQPPIVQAFAQVLSDAERARASLQAKYQFASWILFTKAYDQGSQPYQDFALLIDLRNSLIHLKPNTSVTKKLDGKGILAPSNEILDIAAGGWMPRVSTLAVAEWAVNSAGAFVADFLASVPREDWAKQQLFPFQDSAQARWKDPWQFYKLMREEEKVAEQERSARQSQSNVSV